MTFVAVRDTSHPVERYLVVLNNENKWTLPGGYVDPFESKEEGARRELKEESGFVIPRAFNAINDKLFTTTFEYSCEF